MGAETSPTGKLYNAPCRKQNKRGSDGGSISKEKNKEKGCAFQEVQIGEEGTS